MKINTKDNKLDKNIFQKELSKMPEEFRKKLEKKEKKIKQIVEFIEKKIEGKSIGFYINPEIKNENNIPIPNFDKLKLHFLFDDFERNIPEFNPRLLLEEKFNEFLIEEKIKDKENNEIIKYVLKEDKNIEFIGSSISIIRENCFDSIYDDLKNLGGSLIYKDNRGFISALKTIDIHRNMLLQKFEKYVVAYVGAGSWLRGEKSNDFDVFVVIDDTDVKKMPRLQVKDQLTKIIWQMSGEVAQLTGIQIHIQVYLLTDFWDALKDAQPVMFTFLRDGVPFYDRGIYSAWKELLKLGKIKPSAEAIDMHMNVGGQLLTRAKNMFSEIVAHDIYNSVLSPSQAILMLKGYNPTTPKETVKMFKEVLLAKEKCVTIKDVNTLEEIVKLFKEIEHNSDKEISGKDVDRLIKNADIFLKNIKKMFEEITEDRTKDSIISTYTELLNQIRTLPNFENKTEKTIFKDFEKEFINSGKIPNFIKKSLNSFLKGKSDYDSGKITITEVNKVLKDARNVMSEIKEFKGKNIMSELNNNKISITYNENKIAELINFENKNYLIDLNENKIFEFKKDKFTISKLNKEYFSDNSKFQKINIEPELILAIKKTLKTKNIYF